MAGNLLGWRLVRLLDGGGERCSEPVSWTPASQRVCVHTQSLIHSLTHLSVLLTDSTTSELELGLSAGGKRGLWWWIRHPRWLPWGEESHGHRDPGIPKCSSLGKKKNLNLGKSCVLESYALWSFVYETYKFLWAMEVIRTLTDVSRRERQRAAWGISCLSKVSRKARVPFKGAIPGAPLGGGQPFSPLACTSRKSYTQKHAPLLICAFEVWVHPQHVSQRHIKQVATPADQVRPPLRERSKLGNQSQFMQGNLCLPFLQLISKEIPFFFKTFWRLKKKKQKTNTTLANLHMWLYPPSPELCNVSQIMVGNLSYSVYLVISAYSWRHL